MADNILGHLVLTDITYLQRLMVYMWMDLYPNSRLTQLAFMGQLLCAGHSARGWSHGRDRRDKIPHPQGPLFTAACPRRVRRATYGILKFLVITVKRNRRENLEYISFNPVYQKYYLQYV